MVLIRQSLNSQFLSAEREKTSKKTLNHLFLHCFTFGAVWYYIYGWLGISSTTPYVVADHFIQFSYGSDGSKVRQTIMHLIWFATV